jgi:hypothetical protein
MKIKFTRVIERVMEVQLDWYPPGATEEKILEIERENAKDDPELIFSEADRDDIFVEIIKE